MTIIVRIARTGDAARNRMAVLKATQEARRTLKVLGNRWTAPRKSTQELLGGWTDPGANPTALAFAAADLRKVAWELNLAADRIDALSRDIG